MTRTRTPERVALYVRASTRDQDVGEQRRALLREARLRGWHVSHVYAETRSTRRERPELELMLAAALRREHDAIFIWRLDRLGRSLIELVSNVQALEARGVRVVSVRDGAIDTTSAAGKWQLATLAAAAEYERALLSERTREGMARVRRKGSASGKPIGRPPLVDPELAAALVELGRRRALGIKAVARKHGISATTLRRHLSRVVEASGTRSRSHRAGHPKKVAPADKGGGAPVSNRSRRGRRSEKGTRKSHTRPLEKRRRRRPGP